jgi:hypothetical protein
MTNFHFEIGYLPLWRIDADGGATEAGVTPDASPTR